MRLHHAGRVSCSDKITMPLGTGSRWTFCSSCSMQWGHQSNSWHPRQTRVCCASKCSLRTWSSSWTCCTVKSHRSSMCNLSSAVFDLAHTQTRCDQKSKEAPRYLCLPVRSTMQSSPLTKILLDEVPYRWSTDSFPSTWHDAWCLSGHHPHGKTMKYLALPRNTSAVSQDHFTVSALLELSN